AGLRREPQAGRSRPRRKRNLRPPVRVEQQQPRPGNASAPVIAPHSGNLMRSPTTHRPSVSRDAGDCPEVLPVPKSEPVWVRPIDDVLIARPAEPVDPLYVPPWRDPAYQTQTLWGGICLA